jgi:class 3 adenylate cyclase
MTAVAPSGVATFLFTDIEGSTRRWKADAQAMRAALLKHDDVLRTSIEKHEGFLFSHTGDDGVLARDRDGVPLGTWRWHWWLADVGHRIPPPAVLT